MWDIPNKQQFFLKTHQTGFAPNTKLFVLKLDIAECHVETFIQMTPQDIWGVCLLILGHFDRNDPLSLYWDTSLCVWESSITQSQQDGRSSPTTGQSSCPPRHKWSICHDYLRLCILSFNKQQRLLNTHNINTQSHCS